MSERHLASGSSGAKEQAEKALKERDRLYRNYRKLKAQHRIELYQQHPRLRIFALHLNRFDMQQAAAFLSFVQEENRSWLCTAPPEIRAEALSLVNERVMRLRMREGLLPLDDPLPGEDDNIWQACKRELI